jgi:hypothetical protein
LTPPAPTSLSFTARCAGIANVLKVEILVAPPINLRPEAVGQLGAVKAELIAGAKKYMGIWDTGATNSVISQKVIDECALKPIGMTMVQSATESKLCETFLVAFVLPNKVLVPSIRATKGWPGDCDVLIGMDIISGGDFAVTNYKGKTTFSFRLPSLEEIDFVTDSQKSPAPARSVKIARNDPCPCGSGKKYKKCCGKIA